VSSENEVSNDISVFDYDNSPIAFNNHEDGMKWDIENDQMKHILMYILRNQAILSDGQRKLTDGQKQIIDSYTDILEGTSQIVEKQKELSDAVLELSQRETTSIVNNVTNTQNNNFNLIFFLTETCKHAMNLSEFVDTLQVTFNEVEDMGRLGYMQGISNIIMNALNKLDITQRPIHCTDLKRQTLYVKENDIWHKDDAEEQIKLVAIKGATKKNISKFKDWIMEDPRRSIPDTREYNSHIQIMSQCLNTGDRDNQNENRIVANIAKMVYLDKATKNLMQKPPSAAEAPEGRPM
jgi:hypothetical protein